jgi:hypothetical protein
MLITTLMMVPVLITMMMMVSGDPTTGIYVQGPRVKSNIQQPATIVGMKQELSNPSGTS